MNPTLLIFIRELGS